ncbi:MAG: helix-turn-helix domain-containing protein [Myxococcota bacterium]
MPVRAPVPALRPFVRVLWVTAAPDHGWLPGTRRERVLPTGDAHIVFRLPDEPLRLCADPQDTEGRVVGSAVAGGPRTSPYLKDVSRPAASVGAQLLPGAVPALLGLPANEVLDRHLPLSVLWRASAQLREQLGELRGHPDGALDRLEAFLLSRLVVGRPVHPAVLHALGRLEASGDVGAAVRESGYSHRHFIALFREVAGLTPQQYVRVRRFRRSVALLRSEPARSLSEVAFEGGYADQAHFTREFRRHAGLTPGQYVAIEPEHAHHVPLRVTPP